MEVLQPWLGRNDKAARWIIFTLSLVVFGAVALLSKVKLEVDLGFNKHLFAKANAIINSCVSILLVVALVAVKRRRYHLHKKLMVSAIILSCLFLLSYICHHLFTGETRYGGTGFL